MRKRCAKEGELDTNNIAVPMKLPVIIPSRNAEAIAGNIVVPHGAPLTPLLGVDPFFSDSVEAMRLVRGYMEAFGLNQDELYTVCTKNPGKVVGLQLN
jgi:hypothetical protein